MRKTNLQIELECRLNQMEEQRRRMAQGQRVTRKRVKATKRHVAELKRMIRLREST